MSERERARRARFRAWMDVYYCWARDWWARMEYETCLYSAEVADFCRREPRPTFKRYLIESKGLPR